MIQTIEELSMNALPALSTVFINGWINRFSNGYSKRGNSINPIYPCSIDIRENIEICDEIYKKSNLDTVFKLTEREDAVQIDNVLNNLGYTYDSKTNIMLKDIRDNYISEEEKEGFKACNDLNMEWFEAFVGMNHVNHKYFTTLEKMLQRIIPKAYYGCIIDKGDIVAVGLGVAERGYVGMYDICVDEDKRRMGLGTRLMKNLMNEASRNGDVYSYLQVIDRNEGAKSLYEKLGYQKQYSYWYRIKKLIK